MKLDRIGLLDNKNLKFGTSTRVLKNTVSQLSKNNKYSLTEPNQRRIINSISELSNLSNEGIVKFLLDTASKLKYATNIKLQDNPINNWKEILLNAARKILNGNKSLNNKDKLNSKLNVIVSSDKLNKTEREILKLRKSLIKSVDIKQIDRGTVGGIKDFEHNLDYFIISSETTLEHKKYVLEKLNYLMSDNYEINTQLKDKKSIVAAELINDLAISTPGHKIPNIKAVNQKQHGICAAISIVRKKITYEDKPNYIDSILSELDNTDRICVYDRSKLGSGEKTYIKKVPIDFDDAIAKGYRIIDASATQWMDMANKSGYSGVSYNTYIPFDKKNFDINTDSFYNSLFEDPELQEIQEYYQALIKSQDLLNSYKADKIKSSVSKIEKNNELKKNIKAINDIINNLNIILSTILASDNIVENKEILNNLLKLERKYSHELEKVNEFEYIPNEEKTVKKEKIKMYLQQFVPASSQLNDSIINKIYENVDYYHVLLNAISDNNGDKYGIQKAKKLYEVGAGIRFQIQQGLKNEVSVNYMMKKNHIQNREACLIKTANMLINKLANGSQETEMILKSLSENIGSPIETSDAGIRFLEQVKGELSDNIKEINKIYKSIGLNDRLDALAEYIENLQLEISDNKNSSLIHNLAGNLGITATQYGVINKLEELKSELLKGADNYNRVFDLVGSSSQISFLNDVVKDFFNKFSGEDSNDAIETLVSNNNLDINNLTEEVNNKANEISKGISTVYDRTETLTQVLRIFNEKGDLIYTPDPAEIIIKKFENDGTIPSEKGLYVLQQHLNRIQKDRSSDEFNSRQGKLKDRGLYEFSKSEKQTLGRIEKNINPISAYVKKQLSYVQQYIKIPLEELKRIVGVDMGHWWVFKEGSSGLDKGQDIRVLEYITGRPHHTSNDLKKAIEKIKETPYSGISSSSVFHDKVGMHAQYIADIEPTEITVVDKTGKSQKKNIDVLYQDNTWGASEHENVWVDSKGLMRTDYSDNRGGTLGYITNAKYRNGNIVERITGEMILEEEPESVNSHQYKKLTRGDSSSFKSPQYRNIILDGKSPDVTTVATSIYDTIFTPTSRLIGIIKKLVTTNPTEKFTEENIINRLERISTFKNNWEKLSDDLFTRIRSTERKSAIRTQEDYDNLSDKDYLKIMLEKTALQKNYYIENIPSEINSVSELKKYKTMQKKRAIKDFEYSFGKNMDILKYIEETLSSSDAEIIENLLKKYDIKMSDEDFENTFCGFEIVNDEFNGSLKRTINLIVKSVTKAAEEKIHNPEVIEELKYLLKDIYRNKLYFNESDISNPDIQNVIRFIDRVFNPSSNEELVKIYRRLQNLTREEFKEQIIPKLNNDDLNIKNYTGYEILKRIQRYDDSAEDDVCNTIYADEIARHTEKSESYREYVNHKLNRTSKILAKYTFDSAYREMKNDLSLLLLPKRFDKYKDANLNKYGAFPAYPRVDYMSDRLFKNIADVFIDPIEDNVEKINNINDLLEYYKLADSLKAYSKTIRSDDVLTDKQYRELNFILGKIGTLTYNDESQAEVNAAVLEAMEIEPGEKFKNYRKYIKIINENIDNFKQKAPIDILENEIEIEKMQISKRNEMFVNTYIRTRYQKNFAQTLQKYKQSLIKHKRDIEGNHLSDQYKEQLFDELKAYFILQEPEELLKKYILSLQPDSKLHEYSSTLESLLRRALDFAKLCDIQRTVMGILNDGIETDVKSAFNKIQVNLNDGSTVPMGADSIIGYIVHNMVYDEQDETALMFIDKLGLNEAYVRFVANDFDYDETKKFIEESATKQQYYQEFTATFNKYYAITRESIENGGNPIRNINKLRKTIIEAAKIYSIDKNNVKIFLNAIDNSKLAWKENPDLDAVDIMNEILYSAGKHFENAVNNEFNNANNTLVSQQNIIKLMNNVTIKDGTEADRLRKETNKKFVELVEYNNRLLNDLHENL